MIYLLISLVFLVVVAIFLMILLLVKSNNIRRNQKQDENNYDRIFRNEINPKLDNLKESQLQKHMTEIEVFRSELSKNFNQFEKNVLSSFNNFSIDYIFQLNQFKDNLSKGNSELFEGLKNQIDMKLTQISAKVDARLEEGFKKSNETFQNIIERLAKIDEAQKKIESLSVNVNSLQNVLTDKKTRGIFGEVQLKQILVNIFGEGNSKLYELQKTIGDVIADSVLYLPEPQGMLIIDSKFPLESYTKIYDEQNSYEEKKNATRLFKQNVKKHINDIGDKYIIPGITSEVAIMFLPAEAIFAEIYAHHSELVDYAVQKKVWICSPTTLIGVLTTIQAIIRDIETGKQAKIIQHEIAKLAEEFNRYNQRWKNLNKHIDQVSKDVKDITVTSDKITKKFSQIHQVKLPENMKDI